MAYYIHIENNIIISSGECPMDEPFQSIEVTEELYNDFIKDTDRYIYQEGEILPNPDYEEIKKRKHRQELNQLTLTKADFWIALLDANITKEMVIEKINLLPDEVLKQKTLIRLNDADHFWRGDPSMDAVGALFGITSDQLDYLFQNKELPINNS